MCPTRKYALGVAPQYVIRAIPGDGENCMEYPCQLSFWSPPNYPSTGQVQTKEESESIIDLPILEFIYQFSIASD
ncbi:hypothetical protein RvY_10259 [Ramazzottius varieornatus]|uniref:Uncharacterized protein n=1 Tax=Ramazzottius varieornatus TaxID=947166 RepID=A0A1D1VHK3_RAMVA|nr:hypothetical protein RvY_10259 [Ramazzottius varieornatus]